MVKINTIEINKSKGTVKKIYNKKHPLNVRLEEHFKKYYPEIENPLVNYPLSILNHLEGLDFIPKVLKSDENSITMEYCGEPVKKINPDKLESIINHLHMLGVYHNDLHAENVLEKDGKYYIIDFALASFKNVIGLQDIFMPEINQGDFKKKATAISDFSIINDLREWELAKRSILNSLPKQAGKYGSNEKDNLVYQDINPLFPNGFNIPFQRPYSLNRIEKIFEALPKNAKVGIDLGCNIGSNCFDLAWRGKKMYGIDYLPENTLIARKIEKIKRFGCIFDCLDIVDIEDKTLKEADFVIFTSAFQWVIEKHGIDKASKFINRISKNIPVMIFDTAQGEELKSEAYHFNNVNHIKRFLIENTEYTNIVDLGILDENWQKRNTFLCTKEVKKRVKRGDL